MSEATAIRIEKRGEAVYFLNGDLEAGPYYVGELRERGIGTCVHIAEILGVEPKHVVGALLIARQMRPGL